MNLERKFDVDYDYEIALLLLESCETLIGGSAKILKKALKNSKNPYLSVKGLDIFFREKPLGSFAVDLYQPSPDIEKIQEITDRLYANLIDKNTNNQKVAEPLSNLDVIFKIDKNNAVRLLARTITKWYKTATDLYMNARYGLGLKQSDRAMLGKQFRADVDKLISDTFTALKNKKSPQNAEISEVIRADCRDISELIAEYSHYLTSRKIFCVKCKLCGNHFLAKTWNSLYCADCKLLQKKNSKTVYRRNAPTEFIRNGKGSNISLRISFTKTRLGTPSSTPQKPSIRRSAASLCESRRQCFSSSIRAAMQN